MRLNLTAPINSLSYGYVSLNILKATVHASHEVALFPIAGNLEASPEDHPILREAIEKAKFYDPLAPSLRIWHQWDLAQHVGWGLNCGFPFFELDGFTEVEKHHLRSQNVIFVASEWAKKILYDNVNCYVVVAPLGVDRLVFSEESPPNAVTRKTDATTFINIGKWEYRKGHDLIGEAFNKAFSPTDNVRLIMNCFNPFIEAQGGNKEWERAYLNSPLGRAGKVWVLPNRLKTQQEVASLIHQADCGVFPARAEGWNLDLLEVLSCGKHAIATDYSAHTEYATKENSLLIPVDGLEKAYDGVFFDGKVGNWAELGNNQMDCLVGHMRHVHEVKQNGSLEPNRAGIETAKKFSWDATIRAIVEGMGFRHGDSGINAVAHDVHLSSRAV